jgi:methylated-DNA-[protein]-cysteine S-methyltransferase
MSVPLEDRYEARIRTPFATVGILSDGAHIIEVRYLKPTVSAKAPAKDSVAHLASVELQAWIDNPRYVFRVPVKLSGTVHQIRVWEEMRKIPSGKTWTYGELAARVGSIPRAVGTACGTNPVPIIIPCHRVIAAGGRLGGFMGSPDGSFELGIKRWLLAHEGALLP